MRKYIQTIAVILLVLISFSGCANNHDLPKDGELPSHDTVPAETQIPSDTASPFVDMPTEYKEEPETKKYHNLPKEDELPDNTVPPEAKTPFVSVHADWPVYHTAEELVDAATNVYTGKVIDIAFDIIDYQTGKSDRSNLSGSDYRMLYTVYTVEITESHKGENDKTAKLCIMGGVPGFHDEEQDKLMQKSGLATKYSGIPILKDGKKLTVDESYLFCAHRSVTGNHDYVINMDQFAFYTDSESATLIRDQCLKEIEKNIKN